MDNDQSTAPVEEPKEETPETPAEEKETETPAEEAVPAE